MSATKKVFIGKKVVLGDSIEEACIVVENGKIIDILKGEASRNINTDDYSMVVDAGDDVIMPGVVDSHVHVDEPGRASWEGYWSATSAAAMGGITTIVDMPLNCIPATVTCEAFATKLEYAETKCFVDVGFWGGIIPNNQNELLPMLDAGVLGFKCFLIHSGVDEFPAVTRADVETAMAILQGTDTVILFHAELECACNGADTHVSGKPKEYSTFLNTRPETMETTAIKLVCELCLKYKVRCHIVHLSSASALPLIAEARQQGAPLTVETCHHYLTLESETIPDGATEYKCCPPIRSSHNQEALWQGILDGHIDMVVSDHSPCTPELKELDTGDFITAWGGIASLQLSLSIFWTKCQGYGMTIVDVSRLLCQSPAQLAGLGDRKGAIKLGYDADFVIWDPLSSYTITSGLILHKHKLTPYKGKLLQGVVRTTVLGGTPVFSNGAIKRSPVGKQLFRQ